MIRMIARFLFSLAVAVSGLVICHRAGADPLSELSAARWKNRLLLWQSNDAAFIARFTSEWKDQAAGCAERDLRMIRIETPALRKALGVNAGTNVVLLIGKDGGVKSRWSEAVSPQTVYSVIDAMPMRQREMRGQTARGSGAAEP